MQSRSKLEGGGVVVEHLKNKKLCLENMIKINLSANPVTIIL